MSTKIHPSDSSAQLASESALVTAANEVTGLNLIAGRPLPALPSGLIITPDAVDEENRVVMEVYSRIGTLKPGHKNKVRSDMLKLALIGRLLGEPWRRIMCFASEDAARSSMGEAWSAEAARQFGIDVLVVSLPESAQAALVEAQKRQER